MIKSENSGQDIRDPFTLKLVYMIVYMFILNNIVLSQDSLGSSSYYINSLRTFFFDMITENSLFYGNTFITVIQIKKDENNF